MTEKHIYFTSSEKDGGIMHYKLVGDELRFVEKTACDSPMYLNVVGDKMQAVLRAPFADNNESGLITYKIGEEGQLEQMGEIVPTKGVVGCHLCRFAEQTYVANYLSGDVFCTSGKVVTHEGKGPHPTRQEAPHTHFVSPSPDGKYLLAVDLGLDAVYVYDKDLNAVSIAHVPAGHGARHLAYSEDGKYIFCANELASTVTVFAYSDGKLEAMDTVEALFEAVPDNTAAAIRVKGEYVYVSHRGDDSIACLKWQNESLKLCSVTKCGGAGPRDFILVDDLILCTNERSNTVSVLRVSGEKMEDTGKRLSMGSPICAVCVER